MNYEEFIASKSIAPIIAGFDVNPNALNENLFDFQRVIVKWALKRGRAAIFANTGLGKTLMQTSWADQVCYETGGDVLIVAPLCVAHQTVNEGKKFSIEINYCREQSQVKPGINITNYEMLDKFDLSEFHGIVLDESSIIKSRDGKTRNYIIKQCQQIPYRLSCTATPSPNDFMELGNQAEFLGLMSMSEMLAMYFIHDGSETSKWILKGHGRVKFWEWLSTWAVVISSPADLGFDGSAYELPELIYHDHIVESETTDGLFADVAAGLMERNKARKDSIDARVAKCAEIVNNEIYGIVSSLTKEEHDKDFKIRIHEAIQIEKYGEMEEKSRSTESCKCTKERTLCDGAGKKNRSENICERMADCKSREKESTKNIKVWSDIKSIQSDDGIMQSSMSNLWNVGQIKQEIISSCGSLSCVNESKRDSLLELQSIPGKIQGQHSNLGKCNRVFKEQWVIWCHRNEEQEKLEKLFGDSCFSVYGALSIDEKEYRIMAWEQGDRPILLSKPSVTGFGMNWQHCHNTAFVGLSDSWEQYYQSIRRFYRFGQKNEVNVHVISAESEGAVVVNIKRKEDQHKIMSTEMIAHMADSMKREIFGAENERTEYVRQVHKTDDYEIHNADCIDLVKEIESDSIDFTIYSPPFASLYTYSNSDRDMGNSKNHSEFYQHFSYLTKEMLRITKPGRLMAVHCMNLPTSKVNDGFIGIRDFRGELIRMFQGSGFIYHSEVTIWKDPVTAMQRTKALGLLHKTIRKDSAMIRQGIPDYLVVMRKPGDNPNPVNHYRDDKECEEVCKSNGLNFEEESLKIFPVQKWQQYASPVWMDINATRTLNFRDGKDEDDVKHICPLQLDVIERSIDLWTNPGDKVFSPFTGIGSEAFVAVNTGRKFIGSELKPSYYMQALKNMEHASSRTNDLFETTEE